MAKKGQQSKTGQQPKTGQKAKLSRMCYECRGLARSQRENYPYTECGLKHVVLKDVLVYRCQQCRAASVEIPNMDGLHRTISLAVLCKHSLLAGDEIRFLRKVAGFTATELAENLGVTKQAVSRWENCNRISSQSERSIRLICGWAIIREIITERSGAVNLEDVRQTLRKLEHFLVQLNPKTFSAILKDVCEQEKWVVDPENPMTALFAHRPEHESSLIQ
jgi:putative zinc finger/helix-turn-helix YgiT family protein